MLIGDLKGDEQGLAYDWIGKKLYYLNRNQLSVCEANGHSRTVLLNETILQEASAIVVDPIAGYLFVSDWHYPPFIGRLSMDGRRFTKIVTQDLGTPVGLAIDPITQRIFWTDTHLKRIEYANYNGTSRFVAVAATQTAYPFGVAFFEGSLYWSDRANHSIFAANALNGSNQTTILRQGTIHAAFALVVFHYSLQMPAENPCGTNNGGCSHLCLRSAAEPLAKFTCACPSSFRLDADGKTCMADCTEWHFRCGMPDERCIPFYWKCGNIEKSMRF